MNSEYVKDMIDILVPATIDTIYMIVLTTIFATIAGFILGILLYSTQEGGLIKGKVWLYKIMSGLVNIFRSIPFIILIIALSPLAKLIVGTTLGRSAAVVSLTIATIPFVARLVEASFNEVNKGVIEVAVTSGASPLQIVYKVLVPETIHTQILNITTACISVVGYTAMAGTIGGGGLGDVAIRYGYQRSETDIMIYTIIILVIIVYFIQFVGTLLSKRFDKS